MARTGKIKLSRKKEKIFRPVRLKKYDYLFLIVCEDENTEKRYFEYFVKDIPEHTVYLEAFGTGRSSIGVVEKAIERREQIVNDQTTIIKREVDQTWAVFDKDDHHLNSTTRNRFAQAFIKAKENKVEIAYSNECFELWLLLHLKEISAEYPIPRRQLYAELASEIQHYSGYEDVNYSHDHPGDVDILELIRNIGDENDAMTRAEALLSAQSEKDPIDANPSTKVHLLVKEIKEWIDYYCQ